MVWYTNGNATANFMNGNKPGMFNPFTILNAVAKSWGIATQARDPAAITINNINTMIRANRKTDVQTGRYPFHGA